MEKQVVKCDKCGWRGYDDELIVQPIGLPHNDLTFTKICPSCGSDDYLTNPWEDDSEG